jgi:hypothetical protein
MALQHAKRIVAALGEQCWKRVIAIAGEIRAIEK